MARQKTSDKIVPTGKGKGLALTESKLDFAVFESAEFAQQLAFVLRENMGTNVAPFDFDEIQIPSGGGLTWSIPGLEGPTAAEFVEGILVYKQNVREFYEGDFDGSATPPTCFSPDDCEGFGKPGGDCATCPFGQWGSGRDAKGNPTKGKACAERLHALILPTDSYLPFFLNLPPTSKKAVADYCMRLVAKGRLYSSVVTRIGLEAAKSSTGINYSRAVFTMEGVLEEERAAMALAYGEALGTIITARRADDARRRTAAQEGDKAAQ